MDELKEKGKPRPTELIDAINANSELLKELIDLSASLNRYHGDPESEKGWLEGIIDYKEEQKQGDIKFRKKTNISSLLSLSVALTALTISITGVEYFILMIKGLL